MSDEQKFHDALFSGRSFRSDMKTAWREGGKRGCRLRVRGTEGEGCLEADAQIDAFV